MSQVLPATLLTTVAGAGAPVLLLHSGGMSSRQWRKLEGVLAQTYQVIAPDFLGSGDNPPWPGDTPFHFDLDVEAVGLLLETHDQPVHLVGHSYGGLIALMLARRYGQRVASLAVYDPVAFGILHDPPDAEGLADLTQAAENPLFSDDARGGSDGWFELFVDYWNGPGTYRALPAPAREAFVRVGRKVYFEVKTLTADRTPASAYAGITAKTLVIGGEKSPPAARRVVARLGKTIPGARIEVVAGAGHMGPISHAARVNELVAAHVVAAS